ncbi:hypothetical protein [Burkholderia pseudomultivorans]|uniref:hypothetical protein n=1 Tax=Burkholderia pseudomultivorans TaxID=1207504 RepID=UPI000AB3772B|nr:hypothetical protein [Burkholderia pseudomultivorans]
MRAGGERRRMHRNLDYRARRTTFTEIAMGYDVHITRKENWFDEDGPAIDIDEWKALVEADPEMRLDGYASAVVGNGSVFRVDSDGLSVWTAYAGHGVNGNMAWFDFRQGNVVVKNPDDAILGKMWRLGQQLGAKVQGDDCELYGADGCVTG